MKKWHLLTLLTAFSSYIHCDEPQFFVPPCFCEPCYYVDFEVGYRNMQAPRFSYGVLTQGTAVQDFPALVTHDHPSSVYFRGAVGTLLPWCLFGGNFLRFEASGIFFSDHFRRQTVTTLATAANSVFFPPLQLPATPGTGIDGPGPVDTVFRRKYRYEEGTIRLASNYQVYPYRPPYAEPYIEFSVNRFRQYYNFETGSFAGAFVNLVDETLSTTYYDFGGGLRLGIPRPFACVNIFVEAGVFASRASTEFKGKQNDPIGNFFLVEENKDNWSCKWKAKTGLCLRYKFASLSFIAAYEFWHYLPTIRNPTLRIVGPALAVTFPPARIGNTFSRNYSLGSKLTFLF